MKPLRLAAPISAVTTMVLLGLSAPLGAQTSPPTPSFATEQVGVSSSRQSQRFDGTVQAIRDAAIASQVQAQIVALPIRAGDTVAAGALLATLDSRIAQQQSAAARAALAAAKAELTVANAELDRTRKLVERNYVSRATMDQAQARVSAASANVEAAARQADASGVQTGLHKLYAPFEGRIASVPAAIGEIAQPGRPLATLYDPARLRVVVDVPEPVGRRILAETTAKVLIPITSGKERALTPIKITPLPSVDPGTRTMPVRLDLPAGTEGLVPGQFVRAEFEIGSDQGDGGESATRSLQRLSVPLTALIVRGELRAVYVVGQDGVPVLRQVRPGRRLADDRIEILAGLDRGDRIAVNANAAARATEIAAVQSK